MYRCLFATITLGLLYGMAHGQSNHKEQFTEISESLGFVHEYKHIRGTGIAIFDYNNDHLEDIVMAYPGKNKLYRNNGDGTYDETSKEAGVIQQEGIVCIGVITGDLDNDGFEDILFTTEQDNPLLLFKNNGNGTFTDVSSTSNLNAQGNRKTKTAMVGDVNLDGLLDIYIGTTVAKHILPKGVTFATLKRGDDYSVECQPDLFFVNMGNFQFKEMSDTYGIGSLGCGFAGVFSDPDNDGDLDLLIANDWGKENIPSLYYRNDYPLPYFTNISAEAGFDIPVYGMGLAVGDYDKDGDLDYYETNIGPHSFFENKGDGLFKEIAEEKGIVNEFVNKQLHDSLNVGWGTLFFDYNNDGNLDLVVANSTHRGFNTLFGSYLDELPTPNIMPSSLFRSNKESDFEEVALSIGLDDLGSSHSVVSGDLDADGDLDLLFGRSRPSDKPQSKGILRPAFYRNDLVSENNWLQVKLVGTSSGKNSLGTHMTIHIGEESWLHEINSGGNEQMSQSSRIAHFGLGLANQVDSLVVDWIGPNNKTQTFYNISPNQRIVITQGQMDYYQVTCINGIKDGDETDIDCGGSCRLCDCDQNYVDECLVKDLCYNTSICNEGIDFSTKSTARLWNELLLNAIRRDFARPTVHARNLFHTSVAMYDAWAAYDPKAQTYFLGNEHNGFTCDFQGISSTNNNKIAQETALSYAAYRLITHRFASSPGWYEVAKDAKGLMKYLGYDITLTSQDYQKEGAAALGNYIADKMIDYGLQDGSNEQGGYGNTYYQPKNKPLVMKRKGNRSLKNINSWQPLTIKLFIDQSGQELPDGTPESLSPEWGNVYPFSMNEEDISVHEDENGNAYKVYHDPGRPPTLHYTSDQLERDDNNIFLWNFALVSIWGSHLSSDDTTIIDISPGGMGNIESLPSGLEEVKSFYKLFEGGDIGKGHPLNPHTNKPYNSQWVKRADYTRVIAEFWADGPDSETPPGHWYTLLNYVSDYPGFEKKWEGKGEILNDLEWDVKAYFTLGGTVHDAAIAAWSIKGWYDYIRPVSVLRYFGSKGQSSDSTAHFFNKHGLPLIPGYIEIVEKGDSIIEDQRDIGKIKLYSWLGPEKINFPATDQAGVGWILAEKWHPYQRPSFVTPPFSGYISGHSTFSRAAAKVMELMTGNRFFPGGMAEFKATKNEFLVFEEGPSEDITLQWATYQDASDQCSLSRIYGGIHPPADDIPGRKIGTLVGENSFRFANSFVTDAAPK